MAISPFRPLSGRGRHLSVRWQATLVALALVFAFGGGAAAAKSKFDAKNAHKVDGKHAVSASASVKQRKGKLVATDPKTGQLPRNIVAISPVLAIPPQGVAASGSATAGGDGVSFSATTTGELRFGFVVPPSHSPTTPLQVDVVYREDSAGACSWFAHTAGLEGPDSETGSDIHNGGWQFPGSGTGYEGVVSVPAGEGSVHTLTLTWPFNDDPGMFIQLALTRDGGDAADTCSGIGVYGIQVRY